MSKFKLAISSLIILCMLVSCGTADVDTFTHVPGYTDNFGQDPSIPDTSPNNTPDVDPTNSQDVQNPDTDPINSDNYQTPNTSEPSGSVTDGTENPPTTENNPTDSGNVPGTTPGQPTGNQSVLPPSTASSAGSKTTQAASVKTPTPTINKIPSPTAKITPTPTPIVKTPTPAAKTPTPNSGVYIPAPGNYTGSISIKTAQTSSTQVTSNGATIDTGNASKGYIMVKKTASTKTKVVVTGPNGQTYQSRYLIPTAGTFYPIPLQMGNGNYTIMIAQNTTGDSYAVLVKTTVSVNISSDYTLTPNLFVNYNASSASVKKAFDLCVNAKNDLECVAAVYNFITTNIKYDYDKAKTVTSNYIPNPDDTLKSKKGICFDYSSLMATMLRAKGIPTRLVIGNADGSLHAWNEVYVKTIGWIAIEIKSNGNWRHLDSTFGASVTGSQIDKVKYTSMEYY